MMSNIGFNKSEYIKLLQEIDPSILITDPTRNEIYNMLLTDLEIDKTKVKFNTTNIILNFEVSVNFDYTFKSGIINFNIEYFNITGYFNTFFSLQ